MRLWILVSLICLGLASCASTPPKVGTEPHNLTPRQVIEAVVKANEEQDYEGMARLMAHDDDIVNYTIGGRKYVGWGHLERDLKGEFDVVEKLEIPIRELKVWVHEDKGYAWFSMEIDYIRYVGFGEKQIRNELALRETGILEKRNGEWILVSWHESQRNMANIIPVQRPGKEEVSLSQLAGRWMIEEEDRFYCADLDETGNGNYNWQNGRITTQSFHNRKWIGSWSQAGNDREGGFEIALSPNGREAKGIWWYERVGPNKIPPRHTGGPYHWTRMKPGAPCKPSPT